MTARKIFRHTLTKSEQELWDNEGLGGWREAMEAWVEDEGREEGCIKYVIQDAKKVALAKGEVRKLVELQPVSA